MDIVLKTNFPDLKLLARGKVRDIYDLEDKLLIVSTDRISAFDVILPNGINGKGKVLTELSEFWFNITKHIVRNHFITSDVDMMPQVCRQYKSTLAGRSMLVRKAMPLPVECVVRGYITGSGMKDYLTSGKICGISLPAGLKESQKLAHPIFTPSTKEDVGKHDESITFNRMVTILGTDLAEELREKTLAIYNYASEFALKKGIIIADTKLEFGMSDGKIMLIDEVLTPDSSRFWHASKYKAGQQQDSMDKQVVRNYLETLDWNKQEPAPTLPDNIADEAAKRYTEIKDLLIK